MRSTTPAAHYVTLITTRMLDMHPRRPVGPDGMGSSRSSDPADQAVCAWIQGPDRAGEGIWILLGGSPAEQVADLAEQFQNWAADRLVGTGRSPEWPLCPAHPAHPADPHRLNPEVRDDTAVWVCAGSEQVICEIGTFAGPGDRRVPPLNDL